MTELNGHSDKIVLNDLLDFLSDEIEEQLKSAICNSLIRQANSLLQVIIKDLRWLNRDDPKLRVLLIELYSNYLQISDMAQIKPYPRPTQIDESDRKEV